VIWNTINERDNMSIDGEDRFDRDYAIEELLPLKSAASFLDDMKDLSFAFTGVFFPDLTIYQSDDPEKAEQVRTLVQDRKLFDHVEKGRLIVLSRKMAAVPLFLHFKALAFLVVEFPDQGPEQGDLYGPLTVFLSRMLEQIIWNHYKNMMASGLHSQVVRDSYEEIQTKNEQLEKSEKQYRLLAESLEMEVNRRGEAIKEAQTHLMHQEKLASIGHLAAGVAHEINNPMGFISSNIGTLKEYTQELVKAISVYRDMYEAFADVTPPEKRSPEIVKAIESGARILEGIDLEYLLEDIPQLLDESLSGADRINRIVSDLKDFAHPGVEKASYADVIDCIESTMSIVWNELKYKTNVIRSFNPVPRINCYPRQLNQVIMNLLVNAAQAIEKSGDIEICTQDLGDHIELSIRDTGHGIPEDVIPRVFDPFFTTKEVGKGTGLGLNLFYNIVKKHHGTIQVKSEVGKGTTFIIKLPVNADL
jgi:two-component system, NtrC family, sensor kinase